MATLALVIVFMLVILYGCVNVSVHQAVDDGRTKEAGYTRSSDSQTASDTTTEMQSRISGIDKSNQEITKNLDKQTDMMKQSRERDHAIDQASPNVPKDLRKKIYKREQGK